MPVILVGCLSLRGAVQITAVESVYCIEVVLLVTVGVHRWFVVTGALLCFTVVHVVNQSAARCIAMPQRVRCWWLQCMSLSVLGLAGGEKVMLERKLPDGAWPRRRYIEEPGFRQFRETARVDAMDFQGRWFRGQVGGLLIAVCDLLML